MTPTQQTVDDFVKLAESVIQLIQGYMMISISQHSLRQISCQKMNVRLSTYHRYSHLAQDYYKKIFLMICILVLIRAVRAYFMYVVVDNYLQEEYRDSYTTWKLMQSSKRDDIP